VAAMSPSSRSPGSLHGASSAICASARRSLPATFRIIRFGSRTDVYLPSLGPLAIAGSEWSAAKTVIADRSAKSRRAKASRIDRIFTLRALRGRRVTDMLRPAVSAAPPDTACRSIA